MPRVTPFEQRVDRYEAWFERHRAVYESELEAIRALLPPGRGTEVGVGTGRFAAPLGITAGVEPSASMRAVARQRGINAESGVAEALPYRDASFDVVLMVTTICFVDDLDASLQEAHRVLRPAGHLVIGFVDRASALGHDYEAHKAEPLLPGGNLFLFQRGRRLSTRGGVWQPHLPADDLHAAGRGHDRAAQPRRIWCGLVCRSAGAKAMRRQYRGPRLSVAV